MSILDRLCCWIYGYTWRYRWTAGEEIDRKGFNILYSFSEPRYALPPIGTTWSSDWQVARRSLFGDYALYYREAQAKVNT